jgi:hypothetical protein
VPILFRPFISVCYNIWKRKCAKKIEKNIVVKIRNIKGNKIVVAHCVLCAWSFLSACCARSRDTLGTSNDNYFGHLFSFAKLITILLLLATILFRAKLHFLLIRTGPLLQSYPRSTSYQEAAANCSTCCVGKNTCKSVVRCLSVCDSTTK